MIDDVFTFRDGQVIAYRPTYQPQAITIGSTTIPIDPPLRANETVELWFGVDVATGRVDREPTPYVVRGNRKERRRRKALSRSGVR
jgi:hypothetical protein